MGNLYSKELIKFESPKNAKSVSTLVENKTINCDDNLLFDPRSPTTNIYRTPISAMIDREMPVQITRNVDLTTEFDTPQKLEKNDNIFKIKLLRNLGYNLNDPRSPSMFINRTPMNLREDLQKTSISENVSIPSVEFAEIQESYNEMESFESALSSICDELTKSFHDADDEKELVTEKYLETNFDYVEETKDPRSPSIAIDRTPMVLLPYEDNTFETEASDIVIDNEINDMVNEVISELKGLKKSSKINTNISNEVKESFIPRMGKTQKIVYEDLENENIVNISTPKKLNLGSLNSQVNNRTPLGCVANKAHIRSKSTESTQKQKKVLGKICSLDDTAIIVDKAYLKSINNDENTPQQNKFEQNNFSGLIKSKSRIPIISHRISNN